MQTAVIVQFSGNAKPYAFAVSAFAGPIPAIGDRVAVATSKVKDGVASLSIATVVEAAHDVPDTPKLLPIVGVIPKATLDWANKEVAAYIAAEGAAA